MVGGARVGGVELEEQALLLPAAALGPTALPATPARVAPMPAEAREALGGPPVASRIDHHGLGVQVVVAWNFSREGCNNRNRVRELFRTDFPRSLRRVGGRGNERQGRGIAGRIANDHSVQAGRHAPPRRRRHHAVPCEGAGDS